MGHSLTLKAKLLWLDLVNKSKKIRFYLPYIFNKTIGSKLPVLSARPQPSKEILACDLINSRINYYNQLDKGFTVSNNEAIATHTFKGPSAYVIDIFYALKGFDKKLRLDYIFGDVIHVPEQATVVKSRPISNNNANSVLLKLDSVRHFNFVKDPIAFQQKKNMATWRGNCTIHALRHLLVEKYHNHPLFNVGATDKKYIGRDFHRPYMQFSEQLDYKFIISIEGNDVATNTKWIMSSNSLCFMPKPEFETWFMEGTLIPNYHYVLLANDLSDLEEKIAYYATHDDEALAIVANANHYVAQFQNKKLERYISDQVLKKYFQLSGQLPKNQHPESQ
ncbi:MAG: lipopolysaccharide A protein [Cellvibrionaceae bacterium]|nr:lipopolysaccharide A protein [Cellvibrionaceae bacterium]